MRHRAASNRTKRLHEVRLTQGTPRLSNQIDDRKVISQKKRKGNSHALAKRKTKRQYRRPQGDVDFSRTKVGGIGGLGLLALVVIGLFMGIDPSVMLQVGENLQAPSMTTEQSVRPAADDDMPQFRCRGSGRDRRRLERCVSKIGKDVSRAEAGPFFRLC